MKPAWFFSGAGRTGPLRFLLVGLLTAPFVWSSSAMAWDRGAAVNVLIGGAGGVAVAKLVAEATRRLHDTGCGGWSGAAVLLVLLLVAVEVAAFSFQLPTIVTIITFVALALGAVALLLRPGQCGANAHGTAPTTWAHTASPAPAGAPDLAVAALIVLAGAAAGYGVTWLGQGMDTSNAASLRTAAARGSRGK